jgi:hypothetical protein
LVIRAALALAESDRLVASFAMTGSGRRGCWRPAARAGPAVTGSR